MLAQKLLNNMFDVSLNVGSGILAVVSWVSNLDPVAIWLLVASVVFLNVARGISYLRSRKSNKSKENE